MSLNVLFISDDILKERTSLHGNVDPKLLYPEIKLVQDHYIHPILGTALYDKIVSDINASGTTTGAYKTLLDDYIIDTMIWYVMASLPDVISYQYYNKGVIRKQGDNTELPTMSDLISLSDRYKLKGDRYAERMVNYLKQMATESVLPEYLQPGDGIDTIVPENNGYNMPIYLDGSGDDYRSRYPGLRNFDI